MINCLISDCARRHMTHIPAGGAAKRFMLFHNKSKTNVAFPTAACPHGASCTGAGQWHLARTRIPARRREQVLDHLPGLFRAGVRVGGGLGAGVEWKKREGKRLPRNAAPITQELCVGVHILGKKTQLEVKRPQFQPEPWPYRHT